MHILLDNEQNHCELCHQAFYKYEDLIKYAMPPSDIITYVQITIYLDSSGHG